ncbi:MAG: hypothetical protein MUD14_14110 [Hydrococcus sp. Prado102]|nr:hypothetical protein [Hydrococcus sp. Prado102]
MSSNGLILLEKVKLLSQIRDFEQVIIVTTNPNDFQFHTRYGLYVWDWEQALSDCKHNEINFRYSP